MSGTDCATFIARAARHERVRRSRTAPSITPIPTYARGLDGLWGMYQWLDRAPLGRNETGVWWRRHDEYGQRALTRMTLPGRSVCS